MSHISHKMLWGITEFISYLVAFVRFHYVLELFANRVEVRTWFEICISISPLA